MIRRLLFFFHFSVGVFQGQGQPGAGPSDVLFHWRRADQCGCKHCVVKMVYRCLVALVCLFVCVCVRVFFVAGFGVFPRSVFFLFFFVYTAPDALIKYGVLD